MGLGRTRQAFLCIELSSEPDYYHLQEFYCAWWLPSPHKKKSQLGLLTLTISHRGRSREYPEWLHLHIQPFLPTSCMQFCPKCTWSWGWARRYGKRRRLQLCRHGEIILHTGFRPSNVGALWLFLLLFIGPHRCSLSNLNKLRCWNFQPQ